ncbi:hypothetical protein QFZ77_003160 [Paenibacillus sp. V4I3]|nr:hypothetical protein [Paenibacillus sp. V4I3]
MEELAAKQLLFLIEVMGITEESIIDRTKDMLSSSLDEKITSISYLSPLLDKNISVDIDHGYASGTKIVDENKAVNAFDIPIMNGRDAFDLNFYNENHEEYLKIDGQSYISEDAIQPIY